MFNKKAQRIAELLYLLVEKFRLLNQNSVN